ncbi:hypothetical protein ACFTRD_28530 [Paenibacillus sp. NPDC056933]|uniref:hypothetical protein n=1 Tax=Paenibacillus sp. NPDC056933 TaxID=3345968 RepID=UPI00363FD9F7
MTYIARRISVTKAYAGSEADSNVRPNIKQGKIYELLGVSRDKNMVPLKSLF